VLQIEFDREDDGRWLAEIPTLPGVMAYGTTRDEAPERWRLLRFERWRIDSNTAKRFRNLETSS
jgi:hypothetical protein